MIRKDATVIFRALGNSTMKWCLDSNQRCNTPDSADARRFAEAYVIRVALGATPFAVVAVASRRASGTRFINS